MKRDRKGRLRRATLHEAAPLVAAMLLARSEPHIRGNATRNAMHRALVLAKCEQLRRGIEQRRFDDAMERGWLA